ncbi:MAG: TonB-dependent receptor [Bryobacteraceae bacterium]|nr:TonB-dependent receptor [Bryobacteraceae bacterium]
MLSFSAGNSVFDARPYSITGQPFEKSTYSQNRYNLTVGGPLRIPKLVNSPKTFFNLQYSGSRNQNPFNGYGIVPTELERGGDFSKSAVRVPITLFDPLSGSPFPDNRIPASRLNSAAKGLLRFVPFPNQPGNVQNYHYVTSAARNNGQANLRINQTIGTRHRFSGGFQHQSRSNENPQLYGYTDEVSGRGFAVDLGWSFVIGPRKVHDLRIRLNRDRSDTLPFFAFRENVAGNLGITGTSDRPLTWGPPTLNFTNYADLTDANPVIRRNQTLSLTDSISIVKGTHTIGAGAEMRWAQINTNADQNARGQLNFTGLLTSQLDSRGQPVANTGLDFADFLLGLPQSSSIRYGSSTTYFRSRVYAGWAQDEWRARPNLTVNLGLRYEYYSPYSEKFGQLANLDVAPGFTGVAVVTPNQPGPYSGIFPSGLIDPDKNNFAPRVGFAWRPIQKSRLQLRGGYSIFYDATAYSTIAVRLAGQPPFANTSTISTSLNRQLTIQNGFGNPGDAGKSITNNFAVARDYRVPYAQTWNFAVQHEPGQQLVVELTYTGTKGTRLDILRSPNRALPGSPLTSEQRRLIGNAVGFTYDSSEGNSIFHSGALRVARRLRKGLSFSALYTLSKSIDNASSIGGSGNTVAQNDKDLSSERGLSIFDQRHNFAFTSVIASPFGENAYWLRGNSPGARLLRDWNLSATLTARSGRPLTARVLGNISDTGGTGAVGNGRADATGLAVIGDQGFFNPLAFTIPAGGRFGNAGRNTIPGPSYSAIGLSVGRSFTLSDRRRLEFRVSSENATNHVNYTSFGTVVNAANYGLPTGAAPMRTVHVTLRLRF